MAMPERRYERWLGRQPAARGTSMLGPPGHREQAANCGCEKQNTGGEERGLPNRTANSSPGELRAATSEKHGWNCTTQLSQQQGITVRLRQIADSPTFGGFGGGQLGEAVAAPPC